MTDVVRDPYSNPLRQDAKIAALRQARIDALEEAAKLAEAKADEWATVWRNRFKADSHMEGKSAGADEIASAIRAMIKES